MKLLLLNLFFICFSAHSNTLEVGQDYSNSLKLDVNCLTQSHEKCTLIELIITKQVNGTERKLQRKVDLNDHKLCLEDLSTIVAQESVRQINIQKGIKNKKSSGITRTIASTVFNSKKSGKVRIESYHHDHKIVGTQIINSVYDYFFRNYRGN